MTTAPTPALVEHGDWAEFAGALTPESVDLLYVDPPFNTGKRQLGADGMSYQDS